MSEPMHIRESETGLVRLFALDLSHAAAKSLSEGCEAGMPEAAADLKSMLGADHLDIAQVEIFPVHDLEGLGLEGYLEQGHTIPKAELEAHRSLLASQTGWLVLVPSRAFERVTQTLSPKSPLRWIGTFAETEAAPAGPEPQVQAAKGSLGAAPGPEAKPKSKGLPYGWILIGLLVLLAIGLVLTGGVTLAPGGGE